MGIHFLLYTIHPHEPTRVQANEGNSASLSSQHMSHPIKSMPSYKLELVSSDSIPNSASTHIHLPFFSCASCMRSSPVYEEVSCMSAPRAKHV
ncbi:hypothetical protein BDR04DRAFT_752120 [Suillus decipiens]|nr:hypothetical protein BDR04DRAFT_752120 [Suillus decipiens]